MHTVKCPYCGYENLYTNIRCEYCNNELINEKESSINNSEKNSLTNAKIDKFINFYNGIGFIFVGGIISVISSVLLFAGGVDKIMKIISVPFLICGISFLVSGIAWIVKGLNINKSSNDFDEKLNIEMVGEKFYKVSKIANYIYTFGFLLFWFGFLIIFDILAFKSWEQDGKSFFFFSLFFWAVGIYILVKSIKKFK